jgi:GH24 family phage-related lysozyme (muramidase)
MDTLFDIDIASIDAQVNSLFQEGTLTQGQFDALVSFDYNLGMARLRTMLGHGLENVPLQLPRWIHDDHGILPGLVARRAVELSWWNQV